MARRPIFRGRELSPDELERIRAQVDEFDTIEAIDDEMRDLIASQWPDLAGKLPARTRPVRPSRKPPRAQHRKPARKRSRRSPPRPR
jgi:hypothetical protein